ncbi:MAG: hypothetical protein CM15mP115_17110 [Alphaproteobacteria bacterium]|nr:MAG: hypothetical protein CM15mP115_17110 [Alphaproteobacteria bacterium]
MCGIGGYFLKTGASAPAGFLDRMEAALAHRGPDGSGRFTDDGAGLVHTRLSIVDLANGAQPFIAPPDCGGKVLIANGEIYNHSALRAELCQGYGFTSGSDCETVLALWARHGTDILNRLRGMYAAALYDPATSDGVLVRDPFGIKPLYIAETGYGIAFASEIAALRAAMGETGDPDPLHAACIIDRQHAPDDLPAFADIRRVAPGETLVIRDGRITGRHCDSPLDDWSAASSDPGAFQTALHDSVSAHLMADVPLGLFFSGGVDSSAILAALADLRARDGSGEPILTYTVRFDARLDRGGDDETDVARGLAAAEGADFVDVPYGKADFLADAGLRRLPATTRRRITPFCRRCIWRAGPPATSRSSCRARAAMNSSPAMAATAPACGLSGRNSRHGRARPFAQACSVTILHRSLPHDTGNRQRQCPR